MKTQNDKLHVVEAALAHAQQLVADWNDKGREPSRDDLERIATEIAAVIPGPAGDVARVAVLVGKFAGALYEFFDEPRDEHAAALGSQAGLAARKSSENAKGK